MTNIMRGTRSPFLPGGGEGIMPGTRDPFLAPGHVGGKARSATPPGGIPEAPDATLPQAARGGGTEPASAKPPTLDPYMQALIAALRRSRQDEQPTYDEGV